MFSNVQRGENGNGWRFQVDRSVCCKSDGACVGGTSVRQIRRSLAAHGEGKETLDEAVYVPSFNVAGFLLGPLWMFYRRMYVPAIVISIFAVGIVFLIDFLEANTTTAS